MESAVGSSEANPIVVDDSSDDEEKPAKRSSETSSPSKQQGDKNRLLGQLHAERLARQARGDASCATSGDEQEPSALDSGPMKRVRGDLIEMALKGCFDVIVHGCNCQNAMGAGIALSIKKVFPEAYAADCKTIRGDRNKLGTISTATVRRHGRDITIANAYTQYDWRGQGVLTDYDALRGAFQEIKSHFSGRRIGYPLIGAGLAKGNWKRIETIICEELAGENHCLVEYRPSKGK